MVSNPTFSDTIVKADVVAAGDPPGTVNDLPPTVTVLDSPADVSLLEATG
jgi:hypothetical protein